MMMIRMDALLVKVGLMLGLLLVDWLADWLIAVCLVGWLMIK
jgi:hypothetical protein